MRSEIVSRFQMNNKIWYIYTAIMSFKIFTVLTKPRCSLTIRHEYNTWNGILFTNLYRMRFYFGTSSHVCYTWYMFFNHLRPFCAPMPRPYWSKCYNETYVVYNTHNLSHTMTIRRIYYVYLSACRWRDRFLLQTLFSIPLWPFNCTL